MNKELELEAEEYKNSWGKYEKTDESYYAFIDGATSKYVEKQKLEFAIEQLEEFKQHYQERVGTGKIWTRIKELEQKLSEL